MDHMGSRSSIDISLFELGRPEIGIPASIILASIPK